MKKKILSVAIFACAAFTFTACDDSTSASAEETEPSSAAETWTSSASEFGSSGSENLSSESVDVSSNSEISSSSVGVSSNSVAESSSSAVTHPTVDEICSDDVHSQITMTSVESLNMNCGTGYSSMTVLDMDTDILYMCVNGQKVGKKVVDCNAQSVVYCYNQVISVPGNSLFRIVSCDDGKNYLAEDLSSDLLKKMTVPDSVMRQLPPMTENVCG